MAGVSSDYPRACLNCKTRVKIDTEKCPKCGDRLKARPRATAKLQPVIELKPLLQLEPMIPLEPVINMPMATRPQDWAEPARRILRERGAWRNRA